MATLVIDGLTHTVTGNFYGSATDSGATNGIGLAANSGIPLRDLHRLDDYCDISRAGGVYAQFRERHLCGRPWRRYGGWHGDSRPYHGGNLRRRLHRVVRYFWRRPDPNGDEQYSTGSTDDHLPNGIAITQDGHYAIFGDASTGTTVEVSDISAGKLSPIAYDLGAAWNSGNVRLSPDGTLLFVTNGSAGQVTAAYFDAATGQVRPGCTSHTLSGFLYKFAYLGKSDCN